MNKRLLKHRIKTRLSVKETIDMSNAGREDERLADLLHQIPHYAKNWEKLPVLSKDFNSFIEDLQLYFPNYNAAVVYDRMIASYNNWVKEQVLLDALLTQVYKDQRSGNLG